MKEWRLYWLIVGLASLGIVSCWSLTELVDEQQYRFMIRISVRFAFPVLLMAFVASAVRELWPGKIGGWLLRNRKYVGLAFSTIMLWQIYFILLLYSTGVQMFPPGIGTVFLVSDLVGYMLLLLMSITSFNKVRAGIDPGLWKLLHKTGIYYIWFIFFYSNAIGIVYPRETGVLLYSMFFLSALVASMLRWFAYRTKKKKSVLITDLS